MQKNCIYFLSMAVIFISVSMTLSGICLLIALIIQIADKNRVVKKIDIPLPAKKLWYLFLLFSVFQGVFTINPLFHYAGLVGHYVIYWIIFWIFYKTIENLNDLKKILFSVTILGFLLSIISIFTFFGYKCDFHLIYFPYYGGEYLINLQTGDFVAKASGFSMNPNILGSFLFLTLFLTLFFIDNFKFSFIKKNLLLFGVVLELIALIMTKSRGSIISLILGLILILIIKRKFIAGIFISFLCFFGVYLKLFQTIIDPNYSTNFQRLQVWETSLKIIKDFPYGVGILNYENIYPLYLSGSEKYLAHAHNWFIHTTIESGILGSLIFFSFFFSIIYYMLKKESRKLIYFPVALISFSVFNLTDYVLTDTRVCVLLTLILFSGFWIYTESNSFDTNVNE